MMHAPFRIGSRSLPWIALAVLLLVFASIPLHASASEMYRWIDEQGHVHFTDIPPKSRQALKEFKVYQPSEHDPASDPSELPMAEPGTVKLTPTKPGGTIVVEAMLNRHLTVPLLLDTGADFTVLTRQVAKDLRIAALEHLPKLPFKTAGGTVMFPITTLQSLRVGTAEARDVNVAIDTDGHMPMGLLGMTFLRHFKVIVDQQRGQIKFER
jgi:clan AA aspartic protease (TIGR02281 family)